MGIWHVPYLSCAPLGLGTATYHCHVQQCLLLAGVECVLFNEEYMNCTWGNKEMPTVNYSLFYW